MLQDKPDDSKPEEWDVLCVLVLCFSLFLSLPAIISHGLKFELRRVESPYKELNEVSFKSHSTLRMDLTIIR
jgi:hypothetical protein